MSVQLSRRNAAGADRYRVNFFIIALLFGAGILIYRIFLVAVVQHASYVQQAQAQYNAPSAMLAGRGSIYFGGKSQAEAQLGVHNQTSYYVYANNNAGSLSLENIKKLALMLGLTDQELQTILSNNKKYQVIVKNISKETAATVNSLKLPGIAAASEVRRNYVEGVLAAPVLGFVGYDGNARVGQYGVEGFHNAILSGELSTQDIHGNKTFGSIYKLFLPQTAAADNKTVEDKSGRGYDLVLTIDPDVQAYAENTLNDLLKRWHAPSGQIIIQEPNSGEIIALTSSPSYDPNNYSEYSVGRYINAAVQEAFEPGSSFKPITMAAAIDAGKITPETTYEDTGEARYGTAVIHNYNNKANGLQTMRQVLERSLNTGVIFAENRMGDDTFLNYIVGFGFGQKTGIDLAGEISGSIANLYTGRKVNFATASFGQGIAVTPLQLINSYSALANGGKLMWPHVVKEIIKPDGSRVKVEPKILAQPITEKTSNQMKSMLTDVVDKGFDKARIPGYDVAGKTGTAQIPDKNGGYLENDQFTHDFLGFAPSYDPRFVILIRIDKPQGIKFAADSLSPVFGNLSRYLLHYYNVPPTRPIK